MMKAAASLIRKIFTKSVQQESSEFLSESIPKCRFVQFCRSNDNHKRLGMVSEDGTKLIALSDATCASPDMITFIDQRYSMEKLLDNVKYTEIEDVEDNIRLLPPITNPGKIIGVSLNYRDQCTERRVSSPLEPIFFFKSSTSIVGALDNIRAHNRAIHLDYENEVAVVIGKTARCIKRNTAMQCVFGYMIAQDITARGLQHKNNGGCHLVAKSMDSFCPLGPVLVHKCHVPDINNLWIRTIVNGEERQISNTKNMIFKIDYLIYRLSHFMTLCPGDIILTGTPAGAGAFRSPSSFLKPGDVIESEIQHLGRMRNRVVNNFF